MADRMVHGSGCVRPVTLAILALASAASLSASRSLPPAADGNRDHGVVMQAAGRCALLPDAHGLARGHELICAHARPGSSAGVAKGDFDHNGFADLAIGVPGESVNGQANAGAVVIIYGSSDGLTTGGNAFPPQLWTQDTSGVLDLAEQGDQFGYALASGDFDGDGRGDLAVGAPGENIGSISDAGIVSVLYGSANGPSTTRVQNWHQDSTGIDEVAEPGDQFGYAVSAWNFGKDSKADLAIGVPFEDLTSTVTSTLQQDAGVVHLLYGATGGLSSAGNQLWSQDSTGINDSSQVGDRFGQTLY